jgi:hypothetical protein
MSRVVRADPHRQSSTNATLILSGLLTYRPVFLGPVFVSALITALKNQTQPLLPPTVAYFD